MTTLALSSGRVAPTPFEACGASLVCWWDASYAPGIDKDGSNIITAYRDKIRGLSGVPTGSPLWVDSGANTINGKPAIYYDGASCLTVDATSLDVKPQDYYVLYFVARPDVISSRVLGALGDGTNYFRVLMNGLDLQASNGTDTVTGITNLVAGQAILATGVFGPNTLGVRLNGVTENRATTAAFADDLRIRMGASSANTPASFFLGPQRHVFLLKNPTVRNLIDLDTWAADDAGLTIRPSVFATTVAGNPLLKESFPLTSIFPYGDVAVLQNAVSPELAPMAPVQINHGAIYEVRFRTHRVSATQVYNAIVEYVGVWQDANFAEISRSTLTQDRDFIAGSDTTYLASFGPSADGTVDAAYPSNAVYALWVIKVSGSSNQVTYALPIISEETFGPPAAFIADGLPAVQSAIGSFQQVRQYRGTGFRMQRTSDRQQKNWPLPLDVAAIRAWHGPYEANVIVAYDQKTGRRDASQAAIPPYPTLQYAGPVPVVSTGSGNRELTYGTASGNSGAVSRAIDKFTLACVRMAAFPRNLATQAMMNFGRSGSGARASILFKGRVGAEKAGHSSASGRRLDAEALVVTEGLDIQNTLWHVHSNSFDYANAQVTTRLDDRKVTDAFATAGFTSDTGGSANTIGQAEGSWTSALVMKGELLTDDMHARIMVRSPDMTLVTEDTWAWDPANWSWYTNAYAIWQNDTLSITYCDRHGKQFIATKPGQIYLVSDFYYQNNHQSDHLAPGHRYLPGLLIAYTGHGYAGDTNLRYRWALSGNPADLGPEQTLPQGLGTTEYANIQSSDDDKVAIFTQDDNLSNPTTPRTYWGVNVCQDTTGATLTFDAYQHVVYVNRVTGEPNNMYLMTGDAQANSLRMFCYDSPKKNRNDIHLMTCNVSTGLCEAAGVQLGYWDGAPGNTGNVLPVDILTLPIIYSVPEGYSARLLAVRPDGGAFIFQLYQNRHVLSGSQYYIAIWDGVGDPFLEASWPVHFVMEAGEPYSEEDVRWSGATFNNSPHSGISIFAGENQGAAGYTMYQLDSADGGVTWTRTPKMVRDRIITMPISPLGSPPPEMSLIARVIYSGAGDLNSSGSIGTIA